MMKIVTGLFLIVLAAAAGGTAVHFRWVDASSVLDMAMLDVAPATASQPANRTPSATAVEVASAEETTATSDINAIGTLQSDESVQLAPEVAGRVASIRFDEGRPVKAGDILVSLDNSLAKASEEEIKVRLDLAVSNYERAQRMAGNGTGTARELDTALAERNTATTLLNSQQVQLAKLDIAAPFDGVVGLRKVSVGSYVAVGTPLVNIEKINVLKVDFKIPETNLQQVRAEQQVEIAVDAIPGKQFTGTIYAIDPMVDVNGRAVSIRARLPNDDLTLRPGLFARILIKGMDEKKVVTVPEAAIVARGQDRLVWTVVDGKAQENKVTITARKAGFVELEGLPAGATVVVAGQARLRKGAAVDIVNGAAPQASAS